MSAPRPLDLTGEVCPYTYVRTKLAIEAGEAGDELLITLDHRPAYRSVPRSLEEDGHEVLSVEIAPDGSRCQIHARIRRPAPAPVADF